jgi:mono/diheme cytochrome c family protein
MKQIRIEFAGIAVLLLLTALSTMWRRNVNAAPQAISETSSVTAVVPSAADSAAPVAVLRSISQNTVSADLSQNRAALQSDVTQSATADLARGQYLVDEVARCWECHTPVKPDGSWDRSRWLQGGPIFIRPVVPSGTWAERAPGIAGFPGFTEAQGEHILEKGETPDGRALQPPMHTYHMKHEDAVAIIAYLRTLSPNPR